MVVGPNGHLISSFPNIETITKITIKFINDVSGGTGGMGVNAVIERNIRG